MQIKKDLVPRIVALNTSKWEIRAFLDKIDEPFKNAGASAEFKLANRHSAECVKICEACGADDCYLCLSGLKSYIRNNHSM